jgi:hypothetical protein
MEKIFGNFIETLKEDTNAIHHVGSINTYPFWLYHHVQAKRSCKKDDVLHRAD